MTKIPKETIDEMHDFIWPLVDELGFVTGYYENEPMHPLDKKLLEHLNGILQTLDDIKADIKKSNRRRTKRISRKRIYRKRTTKRSKRAN